jgi:hypothetical protein
MELSGDFYSEKSICPSFLQDDAVETQEKKSSSERNAPVIGEMAGEELFGLGQVQSQDATEKSVEKAVNEAQEALRRVVESSLSNHDDMTVPPHVDLVQHALLSSALDFDASELDSSLTDCDSGGNLLTPVTRPFAIDVSAAPDLFVLDGHSDDPIVISADGSLLLSMPDLQSLLSASPAKEQSVVLVAPQVQEPGCHMPIVMAPEGVAIEQWPQHAHHNKGNELICMPRGHY